MRCVPGSLVGRIALTTALTVISAGSVVATVSVLLANRLSEAQEDYHLREAVGIVAWELRKDPSNLANADHEIEEFEQSGISTAIYQHGKLVAGDPDVGQLAAGACRNMGALRACAQNFATLTLVVARDATPLREREQATMLSAAIAVLITALLGTLASFVVARTVVKPLSRLRSRVEEVPDEDPGAADLGAHDGVLEIDALRSTLNESFARLGAALLQSRRFARDAAHQLRTPLTAMLGEIDLALERAPADMKQELTRVRRLADRLASLIDHLLILARPHASTEGPGEVELLDVIEEALDAFPLSVRARVVSEASSTVVRGDHALLVAMLTNALDNALKYSAGRVSVALQRRADAALLSIHDEGPGIPNSERDRVFEPFYRMPWSRAGEVPGHGIGLALIAHVVRLHGGAARFVDGSGARLELELPTR